MLKYVLSRLLKKARPSAIKDSRIDRTSAIEAGCQVVKTTMGRHSYCGYDCVILNTSIGNFCSISDNVVIGGSQHPLHFVSTSPVFLAHRDSVKAKFAKHPYSNLPVTKIGHDVWIGRSAMIKSGVTIGVGAVVGMGSVVTKDVPPYAIVAGNPARIIRYRFTDVEIKELLSTKWWERDDQSLKRVGAVCDDVAKFLRTER